MKVGICNVDRNGDGFFKGRFIVDNYWMKNRVKLELETTIINSHKNRHHNFIQVIAETALTLTSKTRERHQG